MIGGALATPPGLHFFTGGGRPRPSPVLRLFSFLIDGEEVEISVSVDGCSVPFEPEPVAVPAGGGEPGGAPPQPHRIPAAPAVPLADAPLERLAWARSGDKGDSANIGIIARRADLLPHIWAAIDEAAIREALPSAKGAIERFYLPGTASMNILCARALGGGGVASLLNDSQGKAFAQRLLALPVAAPERIIAELKEASHGV